MTLNCPSVSETIMKTRPNRAHESIDNWKKQNKKKPNNYNGKLKQSKNPCAYFNGFIVDLLPLLLTWINLNPSMDR